MNVINRISPVGQASTNTSTLVTGSILNTARALTLAFTVKNSGADSIDYTIVGGNASDLSDGVIVQSSATILANAFGSYSIFVPTFQFYGVKVKSTVNGTPGTGLVVGVVKG